jgi:hypothetical protein
MPCLYLEPLFSMSTLFTLNHQMLLLHAIFAEWIPTSVYIAVGCADEETWPLRSVPTYSVLKVCGCQHVGLNSPSTSNHSDHHSDHHTLQWLKFQHRLHHHPYGALSIPMVSGPRSSKPIPGATSIHTIVLLSITCFISPEP